MALASGLPRLGFADEQRYAGVESVPAPGWFAEKLPQTRWQAVNVQGEAITPFKDATHYNNFYEFGPNKGDPAENASALKTEPWSVVIDGEVGKPVPMPSRISSNPTNWKSASIGCAAWKPGRW